MPCVSTAVPCGPSPVTPCVSGEHGPRAVDTGDEALREQRGGRLCVGTRAFVDTVIVFGGEEGKWAGGRNSPAVAGDRTVPGLHSNVLSKAAV